MIKQEGAVIRDVELEIQDKFVFRSISEQQNAFSNITKKQNAFKVKVEFILKLSQKRQNAFGNITEKWNAFKKVSVKVEFIQQYNRKIECIQGESRIHFEIKLKKVACIQKYKMQKSNSFRAKSRMHLEISSVKVECICN